MSRRLFSNVRLPNRVNPRNCRIRHISFHRGERTGVDDDQPFAWRRKLGKATRRDASHPTNVLRANKVWVGLDEGSERIKSADRGRQRTAVTTADIDYAGIARSAHGVKKIASMLAIANEPSIRSGDRPGGLL